MKKIFFFLSLVMIFTGPAKAQKHPTLDHLIPGGDNYLYIDNIDLTWWGDDCIQVGSSKIQSLNLKTGKKEKTLFTLGEINHLLKENGYKEITGLNHVQFPKAKHPLLLLRTREAIVLINFVESRIIESFPIPRGGDNIDFSIESLQLAYTLNNNLFVGETQITDNPEGVVAGQSVHRNEFGINKGTFWSPTGEFLAFYSMDERMVSEYPFVDVTARIASLTLERYPMAGMTSHQVRVGLFNTKTGETIYLNTGDPTNRFFTNISWSPDEKSIYLFEVNREQNHTMLCQYDVATGNLNQVLFEESNEKYVEPQNPIVFLPWDKTSFIYQSQKSGFNHLYLFNILKGEEYQLTKGEWVVQEFLGFNEARREFIYRATTVSPLQSNLYRVNTKGQVRPIGNQLGVHKGLLNASGSMLIDTYSTPHTPNNLSLITLKNNKEVLLFEAENPYKDFAMPQIETGSIKASDGQTDLYYRLIKPADFDPAKKYPTIIYVYGGPHAHLVDNGWMNGARGWDLYMANQGYILFSLDNRGSQNRGFDFESSTFRQLGVLETEDQVEGIKFLKSQTFVDSERIGVHGWSFGGHMTISMLLRHPDLVKVGVAGGPVVNWAYYEIMYGERYMDTPQTNPEGYEKTNLCNLAPQLKGHLLLIHDDHDSTCVPQHTLSFIQACIKARTYPDLFIYPNHKHNVRGRDRVHLHHKITQYFKDYL